MNNVKKCWVAAFAVALGMLAQGAAAQVRNQEFPRDVHGLWWQPSDPGWGVTMFDHEAAMSSALLVYDYEGKPTWFFTPRLGCYRETSRDILVGCSGAMYRVTGPWFGESTFRPDQVRAEVAGEWSGTFATPLFAGVGPNPHRTLFILYSIDGRTFLPAGDMPMFVQTIDPEAPWFYLNTPQSGLWGVPAESGWGIGLFQQGKRLVATLFVHDRDGEPRWYVVNARVPDSDFSAAPLFFEGEVYETRGHYWAFRTVEQYQARQVGRASVRFGAAVADGAQLRYSIDGVEVSKTIYRMP
jgi:hypothetical protein